MTAVRTPIAAVTSVPPQSRRHARALWHAAAVVAIWASSLLVAVVWVAGGGVDAIAQGSDAWNAAGRLTGLVASNLLLLQVLFMARVPLFERGLGRDRMTRLHRVTGFWSFWLMLAHIALLMVGYAVAAGIDPVTQLWQFIWDYPGMLLATAGTALLIGVTVTSIRRARRRLRYESWHLLHLYAYLGVGLALPHQLWTGADFTSSPVATAYWWTLWAVAAGSVLIFRLLLPLLRSARAGLRVVSVEQDGDGGVSVRMQGRRLRTLGARAGQFFVWRFLDGPGWTRGHPFSLAAAPRDDELVIAARMVGDGTRRLAGLAPGTRVLIEGPYGRMTGAQRAGTKLLLIGAGAGVAPLVALLEDEAYEPGDALLITRDSHPAAGLRQRAIAELEAGRGVRHIALDGPRSPDGGWLPQSHAAWRGADVFTFLVGDLAGYDAYVCGPDAWMSAVVADLGEAGLDRARIHTESFAM